MGLLDRPAYGYNLYYAALQAKALGLPSVSAIEFGVASGKGLLILETYAECISRMLGVAIEAYGFDTGQGLPGLQDYRDIPHQWQAGLFPMDHAALTARLRSAKLILGNVQETLRAFYDTYRPAPVGAILFDVDLYSSTKAAFTIFDTEPVHLLPRIRCYFDDILGNEISLTNDFVGEPLAIAEYNKENTARKITPVYHLRAKSFRQKWYSKCYVHHHFQHPRYTQRVEYR